MKRCITRFVSPPEPEETEEDRLSERRATERQMVWAGRKRGELSLLSLRDADPRDPRVAPSLASVRARLQRITSWVRREAREARTILKDVEQRVRARQGTVEVVTAHEVVTPAHNAARAPRSRRRTTGKTARPGGDDGSDPPLDLLPGSDSGQPLTVSDLETVRHVLVQAAVRLWRQRRREVPS